ncbi:tetratricopeptide repeat protein [Chitinimonas sp.]|uniref:tetratricopeptide repeat protein n=1 Tax=Chitinimonas sp. TaxID=1934313 RepID=UPI0035B017FF
MKNTRIPPPWRRPLLITLLSLGLGWANIAQAADPAAEVVSITGRGDYRLPRAEQWLPASLRLQLAAESLVRTGPASSMGLLLVDQAQIKLGQNSVFQLRAIANGNSGTRMWLQQGKAWSQTKNAGLGLSMETPTMTAGIHGTDWLMEVAEDGSSTITVLSGLVSVSNAYGAVEVGKNETATALPGQAPVKRQLVSTAERAQWVTSHTLHAADFPEWASLLGNDSDWQNRVPDYQNRLATLRRDSPSVAAWLLGAELAAWAGDTAQARALLAEGQTRYPNEHRFGLLAAKLALGAGDAKQARQLLAQQPDSFNRALLLGQLAQFDGEAGAAEAAYQHAIALQPDRAEGWLGLGTVRAEREHWAAARSDLAQAKARGASQAAAEQAWLATLADLPTEAQAHYQAALAANPADYVAWTGLGVARLKAGDNAGALDALLHANTIEPRYARSELYMGAAYYRLGKIKAAQDTLTRAAELDPNDPLPWRFKAMIARDQWQPEQALAADRQALARQSRLRSLNQLAVDKAGSVSLGASLSDLGLANWAQRLAQDGLYEYWGGSHLFLASQYPSGPNRQSELMQGLLSDPTALGVTRARQSLLVRPGVDGELGVSAYRIAGGDARDAHAAVSGYHNDWRPLAWLADLDSSHFSPGDSQQTIQQTNLTVGLGGKLTQEFGLFAYGSRQRYDLSTPGAQQAASNRADTGLSWRLAPQDMAWLKAGTGDTTNDRQNPQGRNGTQRTTISQHDAQLRLSHTGSSGWTFSAGLEHWRNETSIETRLKQRNPGETNIRHDDDGGQIWLSLHQASGALQWQTDLAWQRYHKQFSQLDRLIFPNGRLVDARFNAERDEQVLSSKLGLHWQTGDIGLRAIWQDWLRPYSDSSLMPTATVGTPLADNYVLAGGRQQRARLQADWKLDSGLISAFGEQLRVSNISVTGRADNDQQALSELDALQTAQNSNFSSIETLERPSIFIRGRIRNSGLEADYLLSSAWSISGGYLYSVSENLGSGLQSGAGLGLPGAPLPYIPRHRARLMLTWNDAPWRVQGELLWRSERKTAEGGSAVLPAGWQSRVHLQWRSDSARWLLDSYARYQAHSEHPLALGSTLTWKF